MKKEEAKREVAKIVSKFSAIPKNELDSMKEEQIKFKFIEPLLRALGWEIEDINKEETVLKGRADYILRIGNQDKLVIEAKSTDVRLSENKGKQAVVYAHNKHIQFCVLTNFKQIRFYHALSNPRDAENNLLKDNKGHLWINYEDYISQFDRLWLLSKESFENGEINKLLSLKDIKLSKPIDKSLLEDLLEIRKLLSSNLKSLRNELATEKRDEIIQVFINRLIFIRSAEDRGLEDKDLLLNIVKDHESGKTTRRLWEILKTQFRVFNKEYDSKLFEEGILDQEGFFDELILIKVIKGLYFGIHNDKGRYMFDAIPKDILGMIYEEYLGTILPETEKRVKLNSKSGKRKELGIYYTPAYIVDYIVKNTVRKYIEEMSIDQILEVKIIDPACGSGSFLVKAFEEVCNKIEELMEMGLISTKWVNFKSYNGRLSISQKNAIFENCIFGVDLDEKAVELAELNIALKILENETRLTRRRLANLKENIRNGNSLIDDPKIAGDKSFNWNAQFASIFSKGGFDVVIGNPPYVFTREVEFSDLFKLYIENNYLKSSESISKSHARQSGKINLYSLFILKSIKLLKNEGLMGFIIPNNILRTTTYDIIRKFILDNSKIEQIVDLGSDVFKGVTASTIILLLEKEKDIKNIVENKVLVISNIIDFLNKNYESKVVNQKNFINNTSYAFNITLDEAGSNKFNQIEKNCLILGDICTIHAGGIATGPDKTKMIENHKKNQKYKPMLEGKDIKPYYPEFANRYILYEKKLLYRARDENIFLSPEKLITQRIGGGNTVLVVSYDNNQFYTFNSTNTILQKDKNYYLKYILALLNSKLINWYYTNKFTNKSTLTVNISKTFLEQIPIHKASESEQNIIISLVDYMIELKKKYNSLNIIGQERDRLNQQVKQTDYKINEEIYKLYEITPEEQKIIEESLK